jgi:hypothetical protein
MLLGPIPFSTLSRGQALHTLIIPWQCLSACGSTLRLPQLAVPGSCSQPCVLTPTLPIAGRICYCGRCWQRVVQLLSDLAEGGNIHTHAIDPARLLACCTWALLCLLARLEGAILWCACLHSLSLFCLHSQEEQEGVQACCDAGLFRVRMALVDHATGMHKNGPWGASS